MKYRLVSLGKLKAGVSEQQALPILMKLTKLPELAVRKKLLAGKRLALITSEDVNKVAAAKGRFAAAGLVVEVVEVKEPLQAPVKPQAPAKKVKSSSPVKRVVMALLLLVFVVIGAVGGLGYWLFMANNVANAPLEAALVTDDTAAIVQIDFAQLQKLDTLLQADAIDLLAQADSASLLTDVVALVQGKQLSVTQVYGAVIASSESQIDVVAAVQGQFTEQSWLTLLQPYFSITKLNAGLIQLEPKTVTVNGDQCPADISQDMSPRYAHLQQDRALFSLSQAALHRVEQRMAAPLNESNKLLQWREAKRWSFANAMVFSPKQSSQALPGFTGMLASSLVDAQPNLTGVAFLAQVDPVRQGVRLRTQVFNDDAAWVTSVAEAANQWLQAALVDRNRVSESFATLLADVSVNQTPDSVLFDWRVNRQSFGQFKHAVENTIASWFGGALSVAGVDGEDINEQPLRYDRTIQMNQLPDFTVPTYGAQPLLVQGPFAVDVPSVRMLEQGVLELAVDAKVAIPKFENDQGIGELFRYALVIKDVVNREGDSLLRDERCLTDASLYGNKNHQPENYGSAFFGQASSTKRVRLNEGTQVSDIAQVSGEYRLGYPRQVQKFVVPMMAGATVTGVTTELEVIRLSEGSVRYKVTGEQNNLLEVRALNAQGQVLRASWKSSFGQLVDQTYSGRVAGLEVYMTNGFDEVSLPFSVSDIFVKQGDEDDAVHPFAMSYAAVQRAKWNLYQFVDMRLVKPMAADWTPGETPRKVQGSQAWPGVKMFVTQNPDGWDANPDAHVYLPLLGELYASMSALSYQLAGTESPEVFVPVRFRYQANEGFQLQPDQTVRQQPFGLVNFKLDAGYEEKQAFSGVRGRLSMRLPQRLLQQDVPLNDLWQPKTINGVIVSLESVTRGGFAGYQLELRGELNNLIAVHGVSDYGLRVAPSSLNFQQGGYWTATIPFRNALNKVRIVTASEQDVFELPFNF